MNKKILLALCCLVVLCAVAYVQYNCPEQLCKAPAVKTVEEQVQQDIERAVGSPEATVNNQVGDYLSQQTGLDVSAVTNRSGENLFTHTGASSISLYGVKRPEAISKLTIIPGNHPVQTDIAIVEGVEVQSATLRLKKTGDVRAIVRCDTFDEVNNCISGWEATGIPFSDYGGYIEFTVDHFTGYGGTNSSNKFYVTSTSNTATPTVNTTRDSSENSVNVTVASGNAVLNTMINGSLTVFGGIIRTTDTVNFSSYWTSGSLVAAGNATFKLYAPNGSIICQYGSDTSGGAALPTGGASALATGSCSPSLNYTLQVGDTLRYVITSSVRTTSGAAGNRFISLKWDTATADTWVFINSLQQTDITASTNQSSYAPGQIANVSGTYKWMNGTAISGVNVNVTFLNTSGGIMQSRNVVTTSTGFYNDTYTIPSGPYGTWSATVNGTYNSSISATNSTAFTVASPAVCINETASCYSTIQAAVDAASAWQTIVITDGSTYSENIAINKNLTITSNGSTVPTIAATSGDTVRSTAHALAISRVNLSLTGGTGNIIQMGTAGQTNLNVTDVGLSISSSGGSDVSENGVINTASLVQLNRVNATISGSGGLVASTMDMIKYVINNTRVTGTTGDTLVYFPANSGGTYAGTVENTYINFSTSAAYGITPGSGATINNVTIDVQSDGITGDYNVTITNSTIFADSYALKLRDGAVVSNSVINGLYALNTIGRWGTSTGGVNHSVIKDSLVTGIITLDNTQNGYHNVTFLNTTADPANVGYTNCNSTSRCVAYFQKYLDVYVNNTAGAAINGATVTVNDSSSVEVVSTTTAASGSITRQNITYTWRNDTYWANTTNHTIYASKSGYASNLTSKNMSSNQNIYLTLTAAGSTPACINETGLCYATVQAAVNAATTGQTVVITDGSTYYEAVNITKSLTITSNGSSMPTISSSNYPALNATTYTLNVSRVNLSYSGDSGSSAVVANWLNITHSTVLLNNSNVNSNFITGWGITVYADYVNITNGSASNATGFGIFSGTLVLNNSRLLTNNSGIYSNFGMTNSFIENSYINTTAYGVYGGAFIIRNSTIGKATGGYYSTISAGTYTQIYDTAVSTSASPVMSMDDHILVVRSNFTGSYIDGWGAGNNTTFIDSNFDSYSVHAGSEVDNITLINTTGDVGFWGVAADSSISIWYKQYLDVYVNDTSGNVISSATILVNDTNSSLVFNDTTFANGSIMRQNITYSFKNDTIWWNFSNFTILANKSGYVSNSTSKNMSTAQNVYLTLAAEATGSVCINETEICYATIQEAASNTDEGQTIVITDGGVYNEEVTFYENITLTSNGSTWPVINANGFALNASNHDLNISRLRINSTIAIPYGMIMADVIIANDLEINHSSSNLASHTIVGNINGTINRVNITTEGGAGAIYIVENGVINNTRIEGFGSDYIIQVESATLENTYINIVDNPGLNMGGNITNVTAYLDQNSVISGSNTGTNIRNSYFEYVNGEFILTGNNVYIWNTTIVAPAASGLYLSNGNNVTVENTTITSGGTQLGIIATGDGVQTNITIRNSTITPELTYWTGADATDSLEVYFQHYLDVYVNDTNGNAISGATVAIDDNESVEVFSGATAANGSITRQNITYAFSNRTVNQTKTNHTIIANMSGYTSNSTSINMSSTQNTYLTLTASALTCTFTAGTSCGAGSTKVLGAENDTGGYNNAHVQTYSTNTYAYSLCCSDPGYTLTNSCGTTLLQLSDTDNAHVEQDNETNYATNACLDVDGSASVQCQYEDSACSSGYTCVLSMVNADDTGENSINAHVGDCSQYTRKLCCLINATNTPPTIPTLVLPLNNNYSVFERYPYFNWTQSTDVDGDTITYEWNITSPAGCAAIGVVEGIAANEYTSVDKLCVDETYNWTVRACDESECSDWAAQFNFTIASVAGITFINDSVAFGDLGTSLPGVNITNSTLTNNPYPLKYNNTGNVDINVTTKADNALWMNVALDTLYFQYADENSSSWSNWSTSYTALNSNVSYGRTRELEVRVQVPLNEPVGAKNTTITVLAASVE